MNENWFTEAELPNSPNTARVSFLVKEVLFDEKSEWGHIQIIDTFYHGKLLAIDGIIQVTEKDEFIYHEMMVALPAILNGNVKKILIAGGGDGGALKQALRIEQLESVAQVEIDAVVSEVSQKFLPTVSDGAFYNEKVALVYQDAYEYIENSTELFDLIVLDLTDPVEDGPAARLFSSKFFELVNNCLAPGGIVSIQCGSLLFQQTEIKEQVANMKTVFNDVQFRHAVVPSYQLTSFGFIYASNQPIVTLDEATFTARSASFAGSHRFLNAATEAATRALPEYQKYLVE